MSKNRTFEPRPPFSPFEAWRYLLKLGRHVPIVWKFKGRKFSLARGDFFCRKVDLAKRWGWSRRRVQRFFKKLKREGKMAEVAYPGVGTIATVIDFDEALKDL